MRGKVLYIRDYERHSREPDACAEQRDPTEATVIILPNLGQRALRSCYGPIKAMLDRIEEERVDPPCDVSFDDGVVTIAVGEMRDVFGGPEVQVFERPLR
jgi:hypothetical protein